MHLRNLMKVAVIVAVIGGLAFATKQGLIDWPRLFGAAKTVTSNVAGDIGSHINAPGGPPTPQMAENARICRENLTRIHTAKAAIRSKAGLEMQYVSLDQVLKEMGVKSLPRCPDGGTYNIGTMQTTPTCTVGTQGQLDKMYHHIIHQ